jgi:glycosyltransferase involved in cell wall biosynthesis
VAGLKDLPCLLAEPTPESLKEAIEEVIKHRSQYSKTQYAEVQKTFNLKNWAEAWKKIVSKPF